MKLKFIKTHKSIVNLNEIVINDFAVITGLNGTGKTHLLHAIENGSIEIEQIPSQEIIYYNYYDFNLQYVKENSGKVNNNEKTPINQSITKNGHQIVQRISEERNNILNSYLSSKKGYQFIDNVRNTGGQLDIFDWSEDEKIAYEKIRDTKENSDDYWQLYHSLPQKVRMIHEANGYFPDNTKTLINDFSEITNSYFNCSLIKNTGYNPDYIKWTDIDIENYREITKTNVIINIGEHETLFSRYFIDFIYMYQDLCAQLGYNQKHDLNVLKNELTDLFSELEIYLTEKLKPEHLNFIKNFSQNKSIFSYLQAESGLLDLTQIANEEKQYQINKNQNDYNGYLKKFKGEQVHHITDEDFLSTFGNSPIMLLNEVLNKYDCNGYEFRTTKITNQYGYNVQEQSVAISLYNKKGNYPTDLESLSSGEKTILALTFYVYKLKYKKKIVASLLLLDEIDSSLHPSMSQRLLKVLYDLFYKELGLKIILSTHSSSTVAFAPENSLYVMKGEGPDRLSASSKDVALEELTFGVPSFSINYENRRQIFVESKYDVEYYEKLYQIFKKHLNPEISLNFIASGDIQKDKNGMPKSNCAQVIEITSLLRNAGNKFIWGIIDWDINKNKPESKYVKVLGWGERYSIENFIFDPLLVTILLLLEKIKTPEFFGLDEDFKIYNILNQSDKKLQNLIDIILTHLNAELKIDLSNKVTYKTVGGNSLELPKDFLEHQGHSLEGKFIKIFPELNKLKRNDEKALKIEILNKVIEEYPNIAPAGLLDVLKEVHKV